MSDQGFIDDLEDMARGEGRHRDHRQSVAGRCLYCSCGLRAQLTPNALKRARERLKGSTETPRGWQVVIRPGTDQEFVCTRTLKEERADAVLERLLAEGTPAEKRFIA